MVDNWKSLYKELIEYLEKNLSSEVKNDVFFEIIFMTYSFVHNAINKEAFPDKEDLYNKEIMTGRGKGKYMYRKKIKQEAEEYIKELMNKYFKDNEIKYIV